MTCSAVVQKTTILTCYVLSLGKRCSWAHPTACFWKLHVACFLLVACAYWSWCALHMCLHAGMLLYSLQSRMLESFAPPKLLCYVHNREGVLKSCDGELGYLLISVTCWYYKSICLSCKIVILRYPLSRVARKIIQ
jgi:hypothetical protein